MDTLANDRPLRDSRWDYTRYAKPTQHASEWWSGAPLVHAMKLNAGCDVNGNGRTAWVGFAASGAIVATAIDVPNKPEWVRGINDGDFYECEFATTTAEYNDQARRVEHKRGLYGVCRVKDGVMESDPLTRGYTRQRAQREARKFYTWAAPYAVVECGVIDAAEVNA